MRFTLVSMCRLHLSLGLLNVTIVTSFVEALECLAPPIRSAHDTPFGLGWGGSTPLARLLQAVERTADAIEAEAASNAKRPELNGCKPF